MNRIVAPALVAAVVLISSAAFAGHDQGLGKSQDGKHNTPSIATAPEPATFALFGSGLALLYFGARRRKRQH